MAYIPDALRQQVIQRVGGLCEYCQTPQAVVIEMEIDHIIPVSAGGATHEGNLCLACIRCNRTKGRSQQAIDPEMGSMVTLFNPRTQAWAEHFRWTEGGTVIVGRSAIGRATISCFDMNRDIVVKARQRWVQAGIHRKIPSEFPFRSCASSLVIFSA